MNQSCIQFTRSSPTFSNVNCVNQTYREQLNAISSYLDGSQIYGSTLAVSQSLRAFVNGTMTTSAGISNKYPYMPKSSKDQCSNSAFMCFMGGENRTSENIGLVGVQTLFLRQHNRIATRLAALNPKWNDETIFYEARRILLGIYQHIIFNEYVPAVIGRIGAKSALTVQPLGSYWTGYNTTVKITKNIRVYPL
jgi:peroxidase